MNSNKHVIMFHINDYYLRRDATNMTVPMDSSSLILSDTRRMICIRNGLMQNLNSQLELHNIGFL